MSHPEHHDCLHGEVVESLLFSTDDIFIEINFGMKNNNLFYEEVLSNSKSVDFDHMIAGSTCITTPSTTWSGKPSTREICFDDFAGDSSGPIIIGTSLGVFTIVILMILLIKKNNNSSGSVKSDSDNKRSSLNKQISDAALTDMLEKLKKSYFPKLSIAESFIKGNYVILKDLSGKIISESNIKGNYVIVNDINGEVISEVKFKK